MFTSSAIEVIERTPWRLVILDPPYYLLGAGLIATSLVALPFLWFLGSRYGVLSKALLWWVVVSIPFVAAGLALCTGRTVVTFSRETSRVSIERRYVGFAVRSRGYPLDHIARAAVETARAGRSLILLTRAGSPIVLTSITDRGGYYEAAQAINQFLAAGKNP